MTGKYAKTSCAALAILMLSGCNMFSEQKLGAYVGENYEEHSRSYYNYAYNGSEAEPQAAQATYAPRPVNAAYTPAVRNPAGSQSAW